MSAINLPFAASATRRVPTTGELANGFGCGPAAKELFDWLAWWETGQIGRAIAKAGLTIDDADIDRLAKAIRSLGGNYRLAGGTANALSITLDPAPTDWADLLNVPLFVRIALLNTDAATLAVTGATGTKSITMPGGKYPCPVGVLRPDAVAIFMYNGVSVEYLNAPLPSATNFFVNQGSGSDNNIGSAASPLASILEAMRRTPIGGICNIGLTGDYSHNQITRLNGRRLNIQGFNAAGNAPELRNFTFVANPIAGNLQDPMFTNIANNPNNTSGFFLGAGDSLQCNTIGFIRGAVSGGTQIRSGQFTSDGFASLDMVNCTLTSPGTANTTWFIAAVNRLSLNLNITTLTGDNSGKIYSSVIGGAPLTAGLDPNSLWNFMCNLTSS
ncbi:hypothetical protein ASE63_22490 [Bosea sp. Root381]|uniref:hypothetical protein n=1 Tax=Bosea sp. Root381 TaxID=1736524 RepID=UPI0006F734BD|nr:hypothetical protein [Bosea sp. Root381]KRE07471.1 hypothetical protein ASE63_22490 [Bosea sp. Root381]